MKVQDPRHVLADEETWDKLTDKQQYAVANASYRSLRAFKFWLRFYGLPRPVQLILLFLRNMAVIYLPLALLTWALNGYNAFASLLEQPVVRAVFDLTSAVWRTTFAR